MHYRDAKVDRAQDVARRRNISRCGGRIQDRGFARRQRGNRCKGSRLSAGGLPPIRSREVDPTREWSSRNRRFGRDMPGDGSPLVILVLAGNKTIFQGQTEGALSCTAGEPL